MKKLLIMAFVIFPMLLFGQELSVKESAPRKFALIIGNSNYSGLSPLANPGNDAEDISLVLAALGFEVNTILDGNLDQMEDGITNLKDKLSQDSNSYGFFFYAGHGVQSNGENYLIPVNASIQSESYLRGRAVSVQAMLDELNYAGNCLNVVVLDACRDNPFGWSRSGSRGLAIVTSQPADSIIVYATSAGQRASDGDGRNGLFTTHLLNNLLSPGLEVTELFRLTGADVTEASGRQQVPAIYNQFFGVAYLGDIPEGSNIIFRATPRPMPVRGGYEFIRREEAKLWSVGASAGTSFSEPWVIGTIRATLAPFRYQFLELGLHGGFVSNRGSTTSYYSLTPYGMYSFFWPFNFTIGAYGGVGLGYTMAQYEYYNLGISITSLPFSVTAGVFLFNLMDVSFTFSYPLMTSADSNTVIGTTLQNNLSGRSSFKFSVGYAYRFR